MPLRYIAIKWKHCHPDEPIDLYSEIDEAGWELRKVEVFADGRMGYADRFSANGGTRLSIEPLPPASEIAADPQFEPREISREDFERVWSERIHA